MCVTVMPVTVQVGTLGSWTDEVGFTVVNPDGITALTRASGTTFTASRIWHVHGSVFYAFVPCDGHVEHCLLKRLVAQHL